MRACAIASKVPWHNWSGLEINRSQRERKISGWRRYLGQMGAQALATFYGAEIAASAPGTLILIWLHLLFFPGITASQIYPIDFDHNKRRK